MSAHQRITISLLPSDKDLISHLENVRQSQSISPYIRQLIRNDMEKEEVETDIDAVVAKVLEKLNANGSFVKVPNQEVKTEMSEEQKDIISFIF